MEDLTIKIGLAMVVIILAGVFAIAVSGCTSQLRDDIQKEWTTKVTPSQ